MVNKKVNKTKPQLRSTASIQQPDFEKAKQYVLDKLKNELAPDLFYHSLEHTQDDVWPAAKRLGELAGVEAEDLLLLETAALYHDIGFVKQTFDHETASIHIAQEMMPRFGYSPIQIQRVKVIIMATKLPQSPQNFLGELMADADLDVLGRDDFFISTLKLRAELEAYGRPTTLKEWYTTQLNFLESHTYFTTVANALRQDQKKKNIEGLKELLLKC
jgi:uncharacterized protein